MFASCYYAVLPNGLNSCYIDSEKRLHILNDPYELL